LRGETWSKPHKEPLVDFESLNLRYYTDAQQRHEAALEADVRARDFTEVISTLSRDEAIYEASRCYSCGNCFECDGCFGACPEHAISKLGPGLRYEIDYDLCTGCQACVLQCPCNAMEMTVRVSEELAEVAS
jgi:Pyruvate/2-oxoacid:ferredoxin oxidoreductase delta subunit